VDACRQIQLSHDSDDRLRGVESELGAPKLPRAKPEQRFPGGRGHSSLCAASQLKGKLELAPQYGPPRPFAQPPCFGRNSHQAPEIRSASRTNSRAAKTSLANRTTIRFSQTV
jgi:hypothetical protein